MLFNWPVTLALLFFFSAVLLMVVAFRLPSRRRGRPVTYQDQAVLYATLFIIAGVLFLVLSVFY
jgi:hypothetical protein